MTGKTEVITPESGIPALGELGPHIMQMLDHVPDSTDDDGEVRLLMQIASTTNPEEIDAPWGKIGLERRAGHQLRVDRIRKAPSDYPGSLGGLMLFVHGYDVTAGEEFVASTGSRAVMLQLIRLHHLDALPAPLRLIVGQSKGDPSRKPQHLEVVR